MRIGIANAALSALLVAVLATAAAAQPEKSLDRCQKTAAKETSKFIKAKVKAVAACLQKISKELIKEGGANAEDVAKSCASQFRKLVRTDNPAKTLDQKARTKALKACDPAANGALQHTAADVLGPGAGVAAPLNVADLGNWCASFGGDGSIDFVEEWIDCQLVGGSCQAEQQISVEYPLVLEWLDTVRPSIVSLGPDPKYVDAITALDAVALSLDSDDDGEVDLRCGPLGTSDTVLLASGQTTPICVEPLCVGDDDGEVQAGTPLAYVNIGDGTVSDVNTGLMWEVKSDDGSVHDWDNTYTWDQAFQFVHDLNNRCVDAVTDCTVGGDAACIGIGNGECGYAGRRDWRLPNSRELHSLVDAAVSQPSIDESLDTPHQTCSPGCSVTMCSCTFSDRYWTSTTYRPTTTRAWQIDFSFGQLRDSAKTTPLRVRAVRTNF